MCTRVYVCVCVYICIYKYADSHKFIQDPDPDPGSDPELSEKSDPDPGSDPKKTIPDPQHWGYHRVCIQTVCNRRAGGARGPQTDKNLPPSTFTGKFLRKADI